MKKVLVLVEGQTEETFIRQVVNPGLAPRSVHLVPIILSTKRTKDGRKFKGGATSYVKIRRELQLLLRDGSAAAVTTPVDYYGLPTDFPGLDSLPAADAQARVRHLEEALRADFDHQRLIPYLSLHEFEALVLAGPRELAETFGQPKGVEEHFHGLLQARSSPEEINDGPDTNPAARIQARLPRYQKRLHGPLVTARVGLQRLRDACPHFATWICRLEALGADS